MFTKTLIDLGLSEKEAQVYLALLEVENDSIIDISKKTNTNTAGFFLIHSPFSTPLHSFFDE